MSYDSRFRLRHRDGDDDAIAAEWWYARRRRHRERRELVGPPAPPTLAQVVDHENLLDVFYDLQEFAGQAPGPDGVTYTDLSRREVGWLMRDLRRAVLDGKFRPGPGRRVPIPKLRGGRRILTIRDLCFRVLSASLNKALTPVWEDYFLPWSMGFRPGRGALRMLAEVEHKIIDEDRWVLAVDDVRKAFDFVPIDDVLADHIPYVRYDDLVSFIGVILRGGDPTKTIGIDQGSAYSPTALNIRLHFAHDQYIDRLEEYPPRFRYADNLVYLCRSVSEGRQAMKQSQRLLEKAGFALKGEDGPPMDLHQGNVQLLGFTLSEETGKLRYGLGADAWQKLDQNLLEAHQTCDPTEAALTVATGWMDAYGPAFESWRDDDLDRFLTIAAGYGFREIVPELLLHRWESSWRRWRTFRNGVRRRLRKDL